MVVALQFVGSIALIGAAALAMFGLSSRVQIEQIYMLTIAGSSAISGLLFLAFGKGLELLTEIAANTAPLKQVGKKKEPDGPVQSVYTAPSGDYQYWLYPDGHVEAEVSGQRYKFDSLQQFREYVG
jgi:surface antigen